MFELPNEGKYEFIFGFNGSDYGIICQKTQIFFNAPQTTQKEIDEWSKFPNLTQTFIIRKKERAIKILMILEKLPVKIIKVTVS